MRAVFLQVFAFCLFAFSQSAWALEYYRYKDEHGVVAIHSTIPPEYVKNGYEVLNSMGLVVRTVPPELSEEEKALAEIKKRKEAEFQALKNRLNKLYRSPSDVDRAVVAFEERILVSIAAQKRRIARHQDLFDQAQEEAAKEQRNGKAVSQKYKDQMEEAVEYMESLQLSIDKKKTEILDGRINYKYHRDVMFIVYKERYYEDYVDTISQEEIDALYYVPPEYIPSEPKDNQ